MTTRPIGWGLWVLAVWAVMSLFAAAGPAAAATITAASCSRADVGAAVNSAVDGDTVQIPAGTCTWTTNLTISDKFFTLQGAGIGQTILVDGVSKAPYPNVPQMLIWGAKAGGLSRLTGITFQGGTLTDDYNKGTVQINGGSNQLRIDHCKFIPTRTAALFLYGNLLGVIDHNIFDLSSGRFGLYIFHSSWNGVGDFGDASWADDTNHGTEEAVFVEDNEFANNNVGAQSYANDGWSGSRVVYRYNTYKNATWANHGTESGGRWRSQRSYEVYNNTFIFNGVSFPSFIGARGGVGVVHNNTATVTGGTISRFADLQYYRATQPFNPWGQCNGSSVWDGNQSGGYPCLDQPGVGKGDLLSGFDPQPVGWPNQISEPTYAWNNTINGSVSNMVSNVSVVQAGRDFFNSPKPGYTPYTYPHPLVTGAPPPGTLDVSVTKSGTGSGTVTSNPAGINCGSDCFESYGAGTVVTLTATPASGSTFSGWTSGCTGTDPCTISGNTPVTVTATFNTAPQQPVEIIIDNGQAGTTPYGKWAISTAADSYGQSSLYSSGRKIDRYVWTPTLPSVGQYEVWVWWTSNSNRSSNATYTVRHASATATLTRDQRAGGSQWQLLGTYQFNAGTEGWVQVSYKNGGTISADAVRFVKK